MRRRFARKRHARIDRSGAEVKRAGKREGAAVQGAQRDVGER